MNIQSMQRALKSVGLYTGRIDGDYGPGTKAAVMKLQKALRGFGMYYGKFDGDYGPMTTRAVMHFQRLHPPLAADGIIGPKTMGELFPRELHDRTNIIRDKAPKTFGGFPHETRDQRDIRRFYGKPGSNQVKIILPYKMKIAWRLDKSITRMTCHKKAADAFQGMFEEIKTKIGMDGIEELGLDLYGGCLNVRKMRGANRYSMHSWGIAIDIDPIRNQLRWHRPKARLSQPDAKPFLDIVKDHGITSLGADRNYDWMHYQCAHR